MLAVAIIAADMDSDRVERVSFFVRSFFATGFYGAVAIVPTIVLIGLGEALRLRSFIYYAAAGVLVGLASYFGCDISGALGKHDGRPAGRIRVADRGGGRDYRRRGLLADRGAQGRGLARRLKIGRGDWI